MTKFEKNLGRFLSQKTFLDFSLLERLNMAIDLAVKVQIMAGDHNGRTAHRDLKPSNIMLDATDNLSIVDLGIGKTYDMYSSREFGSSGTVAFVAPEQFTCSKQSHKVDIWALGKLIILIVSEWSFGWQLLWSPKFLKPYEINALGPLVNLIDLIKDMIKVSYHYTYCSIYWYDTTGIIPVVLYQWYYTSGKKLIFHVSYL